MSTQRTTATPSALPFDLSAPVTKPRPKKSTKTAATTPKAGVHTTRNLEQVRKAKTAKRSSRQSASAAHNQWRLDERTRQTGKAGIASARQVLASARQQRFAEMGDISASPTAA